MIEGLSPPPARARGGAAVTIVDHPPLVTDVPDPRTSSKKPVDAGAGAVSLRELS